MSGLTSARLGARRARRSVRGLTLIESAIGIALFGSLLAVAIPAFVKSLVSSKFIEPVEGLNRIGATACARVDRGLPPPPSAPLTPSEVPRGKRVVDPPGTWESPTWRALDFRPSENGAPHSFSFAFDDRSVQVGTALAPAFVARAHGDLDGDGVTSTFEIRTRPLTREGAHLELEPGMYVEAEVE